MRRSGLLGWPRKSLNKQCKSHPEYMRSRNTTTPRLVGMRGICCVTRGNKSKSKFWKSVDRIEKPSRDELQF